MNKIKTRKKARIKNTIDKCLCVVFIILGIAGFSWDFLVWYFSMTVPTWVLVIGAASAFGLILLSLAWYEILDRESDRFWYRD